VLTWGGLFCLASQPSQQDEDDMADRAEPSKPRKPRKPPRKKTAPSRSFSTKIANGSAEFLAPSGAVDGGSLCARRFRELSADIASDMGGIDQLSAVQKQLVKRFVGASIIGEMTEAEFARTGKIDAATIASYATLANTSNRLAGSIGIRRAVIDATPTLEQYLSARAQEASPAPKDEDPDDDDG
jgi:hypothetical protein